MTKVKHLTSVSKAMQHYGKPVYYQKGNTDFKGLMRKQEIPFVELPYLPNDVVFYRHNHEDKYAVIVTNSSRAQDVSDSPVEQEVYITNAIPLDMDWDLLIEDCRYQMQNNPPMEMDTKAKLILDIACDQVLCGIQELAENPELLSESVVSKVRGEIAFMGYRMEDLKTMDHHDIDQKVWDAIVNE